MTSANVNGITIEYDIHGDDGAEPLLLVMGLSGQLISWPMEFVDLLVRSGFKVIRFDNRDIGLSTKMPAPAPTIPQLFKALVAPRLAKSTYTISDLADDAVGLLEHLGIERAHVVGISMGGMIGQAIAIRHPHTVLSLTSIMSNTGDRRHGLPKVSLLRQLPRLVNPKKGNPVDNGVELFRLISGPDFPAAEVRQMTIEALQRSGDTDGTARQTLAIMASPDRTEGLRRVKAPTLVVHGLVDPLVRPSGGLATARAVPGARLVMYPDMGHDLPPSRWVEIVGEIVRNAERAGAKLSV